MSARSGEALWLAKATDRILGLLSAIMLFGMMSLTVADVIGRYLLNAPLHGAYELTEVLLAVVVFGAAPLVTARGTHVTTSLFDGRMSPRVMRVRDASVAVFCAAICAVLAWRLWAQADAAAALGQGTALLGVPVAPVIYFMAVMSAACVPLFFVAILTRRPGMPAQNQSSGATS
jgi:TRAP-type C4-dicarboxylate transport system permease small subunit